MLLLHGRQYRLKFEVDRLVEARVVVQAVVDQVVRLEHVHLVARSHQLELAELFRHNKGAESLLEEHPDKVVVLLLRFELIELDCDRVFRLFVPNRHSHSTTWFY